MMLKKQGSRDDAIPHSHKVFNRLILQGKLKASVRWITERKGGGVLDGEETDTKTGLLVKDTLKSKHPNHRIPLLKDLTTYDNVPEMLHIDITENTLAEVAKDIKGSAGPVGCDSLSVQQWLLHFSGLSKKLRETLVTLGNWLSNESPPWAAYRAIMSGRLIAIDKCPGVRPIGVGGNDQKTSGKIGNENNR